MVRPAAFGFNAETAASNAMQHRPEGDAAALNQRARDESAGLQRALESEGVRVLSAEDSVSPAKPDALFPNNWVSFHADGTLVLYPMLGATRRLERRTEIVDAVCATFGFQPRRRLDLSAEENSGRFLEGTGSLVLDHVGRVAYACRSPRTDESLVREWARLMDFEPVVFDATDAAGQPYYHTNVMMWIGTRCAMVCTESIAAADRERVRASLAAGGRELLEIDRAAVDALRGQHARARQLGRGAGRLFGAGDVRHGARGARRAHAAAAVGLRRCDARRAGADHRTGRRRQRALHAGRSAGAAGLSGPASDGVDAGSAATLAQRVFGALADGAVHSGEQLAASQAVTRSAIWKTVGTLQELGVPVESVPSRGYRLAMPLVPLDGARIRELLDPQVRARMRSAEVAWSLASTNSALARAQRASRARRASGRALRFPGG